MEAHRDTFLMHARYGFGQNGFAWPAQHQGWAYWSLIVPLKWMNVPSFPAMFVHTVPVFQS